jgi:hypothetical protein
MVQLLRSRDASAGDSWLLYLTPNLIFGMDVGLTRSTAVHVLTGLRPELVLKRPYGSLGLGGYLEASTRWWHDAILGAGCVLVPSSWIVPSAGVYERYEASLGWRPGIAVGLFLGSHASNKAVPKRQGTFSANLHSWTGPFLAENAGLRVEGRWGIESPDRSVTVALQLDLDLLVLTPMRVIGAVGCCR